MHEETHAHQQAATAAGMTPRSQALVDEIAGRDRHADERGGIERGEGVDDEAASAQVAKGKPRKQKGAKKVKSARFHVDIGDTQLSVCSTSGSQTLIKAIAVPAIEGWIETKDPGLKGIDPREAQLRLGGMSRACQVVSQTPCPPARFWPSPSPSLCLRSPAIPCARSGTAARSSSVDEGDRPDCEWYTSMARLGPRLRPV